MALRRREVPGPGAASPRRHLGEYELAPTFSIVVTVEDGALFIQVTNQGKLSVVAETETEFSVRAVAARITSTRDRDG